MANSDKKEWTLMFYFASDNPLAPGIVSQLKAIKQAGFHRNVNVIAHFDPFTAGTPTHIFDVNLIEKIENPEVESKVGFIGYNERDPYIKSLMEDKLWGDETGRDEKTRIRDSIKESLKIRSQKLGKRFDDYDPPELPIELRKIRSAPPKDKPDKPATSDSNTSNGELPPAKTLEAFLDFCSSGPYQARHYILFILGHGVVVGSDVFLFDEHADGENSLSLKALHDVLEGFKTKVKKQGAQFEMVSFHSCSVSSVEVAYELQGTANYMLASQSPAFVGSWPYRQILIRVFNDIKEFAGAGTEQRERELVKGMLKNIADYCFFNSGDFILAGHSFDVSLCSLDLDKGKSAVTTERIKALSERLRKGLTDRWVMEFILLAHWRSQSYFQESHTDLFDFCFCLSNIIAEFRKMLGPAFGPQPENTYGRLGEIQKACQGVMEALAPNDDNLIIYSRAAGPEYQYAHGLSVFFPWSKPLDGSPIMDQYPSYKFEAETEWFEFLTEYFEATRRLTNKSEMIKVVRAAALERGEPTPPKPVQSPEEILSEDIANLVFSVEGQLNRSSVADILEPKTHPPDPMGDECTCSPIKNFPRDTRALSERRSTAYQEELPINLNFFNSIR